jgi:hypothetical protein
LTVFSNTVGVIFIWYETGFMRLAVFADVDGRALFAVIMASSSIDRASLISNVLFVDEFECIECSSSVATIISCIAGNDNLGGDVDVRPGSLSGNLYSVR